MNSEILSKIKIKLKDYLKDKRILDVVVFGSAVKGKAEPRDIDIAIISKDNLELSKAGFHISLLKPEDFLINPPSIVNTILREGYSLKSSKSVAETLKFESKALFSYSLEGLSPSEKVRAVNVLRGKNGKNGLIKESKGEWLANQVFIIPPESAYLTEQFLIKSKIKFKKYYTLMH